MISAKLKEETKSLHAQTEKSLNAKSIFSPHFTVKEYEKILSVLYAAHVLLEDRLQKISDPALSAFCKKHYHPHYPLIKKDLDNLKVKISHPQDSEIEMTDLNSIGVLYVLKGSSMGAKYINKQLQETSIHWPHFSGEFYKASASQTMDEWKAFCESLESLNLHPEEIEEVVEGARMAFRTFIRSGNNTPSGTGR